MQWISMSELFLAANRSCPFWESIGKLLVLRLKKGLADQKGLFPVDPASVKNTQSIFMP